jgi:hypothetical protein
MPRSYLEDNCGDRESSVREGVKKNVSDKNARLKVQL